MKRLHGRVAVITGAGSGIGRSLAQKLDAEGCHLALADVNEEGLAQTARLLTGANTISTHTVDVSDKAAMESFVAEVIEAHGGVNLVINNAGISIEGTFEEQSLEDWETIMGINLWGVVYGCKLFLPHLKTADEGHIVNVSSLFGILGIPSQTSYCTTKFAVRGLSEALWEELDGTHVGVTVVHPGGVNTNIAAASKSYSTDEVGRQRAIDFFARKTLSADVAAGLIVGAIKGGKRRLVITREAVIGDWLKRLFPVWGNGFVVNQLVKVMGRGAERAEKRAEFMAARGRR